MNLEPITFEEYEAAYRRFVSCLQETGIEFIDRGLDPEHQRFEYATQGDLDPVTGKIPTDDCYEREFEDADRRWQYQQQAPHSGERFSRAVAFFAERGVTDFPPEYIESGSIGGLIHHASSVVGERISHEYSEFEMGYEVRQRIAGLENAPAPEPWALVAEKSIRHLLAVGFSKDATLLLVVGRGRWVIDVATGEIVAEDPDPNIDAHLTENRQLCAGLGPMADEFVPISGFFGGGLATSTADSWWLFRCAIDWPTERVVLQARDANLYNSFRGLTQLPGSNQEIRAAGFSPDGRSLVVATTSRLKIWQRPPILEQ